MKRVWRALPEAVRASFHQSVQQAADRLTPWLVRLNWRRGQAAAGPLTLVGFFRSSVGIGRGARLLAAALGEAGVALRTLDVSRPLGVAVNLDEAEAFGHAREAVGEVSGGVIVTHFNPPELYRWIQRTGGRGLRRRRHIGYWAWELPTLPQGWREAFDYVDEVWCPSRFTAEAVRRAAPDGLPVRVVAHPVFMTPSPSPDRPRFGLPEAACVVLTVFDLKSTLARKNPLGAIAAYRRATPTPDGRSMLVCKLNAGRSAAERALEAQVEAVVAGRADIRLLRTPLSEADMTLLVASADVILSLHRAEGFGLLAAEGLWLGKPVVATAWSGVMDFLDADSAVLIPWTQSPVQDSQDMYKDGWWAEPDIDAAADALRRLIDDPAERAALGLRARRRALAVFDEDRWRTEIMALLGPATVSDDGVVPDAIPGQTPLAPRNVDPREALL